ncbi:hypothetical protein CDL12_21142 [Handroanthus impetiginosus]|uniref:Uncharacterized protein n=1 Tax=Handroanthus impetiginosus TaxID=429701 RepID=A0A2G9GM55_9LAMI|nr:hypothetical protein CDL12_21142 [Handroanthus impetiginosus]
MHQHIKTLNSAYAPSFAGPSYTPNWKISKEESSVLHNKVGGSSYELYRGMQLPRDHATLVKMNMARLEEYGAHTMMQSMLMFHQMSLQSSHWHNLHEARKLEIRDLKKNEVEL